MENYFWVVRDSKMWNFWRKKLPDDAEWMKLDVKYQIFDSPTHPGGFEDRQVFIEKLIEERCKCDKKIRNTFWNKMSTYND